VVLALLVWIWSMRRKLNRQIEEYEDVLKKHGLLVNGVLIGNHENG